MSLVVFIYLIILQYIDSFMYVLLHLLNLLDFVIYITGIIYLILIKTAFHSHKLTSSYSNLINFDSNQAISVFSVFQANSFLVS